MSSEQTRREEGIREQAREDVRMGRVPNSGRDSRSVDHHIYTTAAEEAAKKK